MSTTTNTVLLNMALKVLPFIMGQITPAIKDIMVDAIQAMEKKAKETENELDDILVKFLKDVLCVPNTVQ
jgi:hypothetical protein